MHLSAAAAAEKRIAVALALAFGQHQREGAVERIAGAERVDDIDRERRESAAARRRRATARRSRRRSPHETPRLLAESISAAAEMIGAGGRAQALGRKDHMRCHAEQRVAVVARLVGIEHDRNAALERRGATRARMPGKRLSAITASASATSASGSRGRAAISRSSRKFDDGALAAAVDRDRRDRRGDALDARAGRAVDASLAPRAPEYVSPTVSMPAGPPSGPAKLARAPRCAIATAALAALPPLIESNSLACVFTSGRGKRCDAKDLVEHRDAGAQHMLASVSAKTPSPSRPRRG